MSLVRGSLVLPYARGKRKARVEGKYREGQFGAKVNFTRSLAGYDSRGELQDKAVFQIKLTKLPSFPDN